MLYTSLIKVDVSDIDWQVAHLFEHMVINSFYQKAVSDNIRTEMLGWVNGETFNEVLFFDIGFYDKEPPS
ncbi:MAG TPA: hypothetical protein VMR16_01030, partial [Candidatus Saccharimonadales bacterium]|nr:hypothetical protein [Candidatus Saccharimonadales bacterium]